MPNAFYTAFDQERLHGSRPKLDGEYRNPFQIDRDRIIFSFAFRRLQSKTQVFQSGEYDFYRTRLTHSIEVAKLGRSICEFLRHQVDAPLPPDNFIDPALTEAICLGHDLGHPPFGHIGERKLNELMASHGGFEGNAQTVRILSELIYKRPEGPVGMSPTRGLLDGVMKYKALHRESGDNPEHHFLYDDQERLRDWIFGTGEIDPKPVALAAWNSLKSIECQIMDWADDTAYSLNDIADGIQAGYITLETLKRWARERKTGMSREEANFLDGLTRSMEDSAYERRLSYKLGQFIQAVSLEPVDRETRARPASRRHAWILRVDPDIRAECQFYKEIAIDLIFKSTQIQQVEFKGSFILDRMFSALMDHYSGLASRPLGILPRMEADLIAAETHLSGRARRICDYLAGLTDGEAIRIYRRLFDPDFGSITDLA